MFCSREQLYRDPVRSVTEVMLSLGHVGEKLRDPARPQKRYRNNRPRYLKVSLILLLLFKRAELECA